MTASGESTPRIEIRWRKTDVVAKAFVVLCGHVGNVSHRVAKTCLPMIKCVLPANDSVCTVCFMFHMCVTAVVPVCVPIIGNVAFKALQTDQ